MSSFRLLVFMNTNQIYFIISLGFIFLLASCAGSRVSQNEKEQLLIQTARSYQGTPYKYGGTTTMGMDCSGLLIRSFERVDVYLPRTSTAQSKVGKKVGISELKPGDIVFFTAKKGGRRKVSHTGLVTEVRSRQDIRFIHASSSRGVVEENLMADYYRKNLVQARRVKF